MKKQNENFLENIRSDRNLRIALTRESHYLFFHIYLSHYVKHETASFQKKIFAVTEDELSKLDVMVAFRNSGKSTIISLSYVLWAILGKQEKKFVLLLSQTQNQVQTLFSHVKRELESNQLLINDFGPFNSSSNEWVKDALVLPNYQAKIVAASAEQSIRGLRYQQYRPDLIIADDVDDYSSTRTRESRNKTYSWFKGEIVPVGDDNTRIIVIGNLLHEDALVMRLRNTIESHPEAGKYHHFPLIKYFTIHKKRCHHINWPGKYPTMSLSPKRGIW